MFFPAPLNSSAMSIPAYLHTLEFDVRDYECDLQGIVNNAIYQHYLEHARHQFLLRIGMDFAALSREGCNLVVIRIEIDYKMPLRSGDKFVVCSNLERLSRLRFVFLQDIFRLPERTPIIQAKVFGTSIDTRGRPKLFADVEAVLAKYATPAATV